MKSKKRVLLVDDEEIVQLIHCEFLKELNCDVESVSNGEMALEKLEKNSNYDLIFVDMGLPGVSGPELVKTYRQKEKYLNRRLPVIALTGYSSRKDKEVFLEAGVDDVLVKPVAIEQLKRILKNYG
jgi:CheY-like chemotaxis protein